MLRSAFPIGRIAGIRIYVHWSFAVTMLLWAWLFAESVLPEQVPTTTRTENWIAGLLAAAAFLTSLFAHELAHSVVARRHGVGVERVTLWLLGGMSELRDEAPDARTDLRIAVAGPLTSAVVGIAALACAVLVGPFAPDVVVVTLAWLGTANIVLAGFNLLPGAPLDGGRVVRAWIWRRTGDRLAAATAAARGGRTIGFGLIALGLLEVLLVGSTGGLWLVLLGWFVLGAANTELASAATRQQLGDLRIRDVMSAAPEALRTSSSVAVALDTVVSRSVHRVFPVLDDAGRFRGVVALNDLAAVPAVQRKTLEIAAITRPVPDAARVTGEELLTTVAARAVLRPDIDLVAVLAHDGRLAGIVTATDLVRACNRSALGLPVHARATRTEEL